MITTVKSNLLKLSLLALCLFVSQIAFAQSAGTVTFTTGDASIVRADKSVVKAAKNDALNAGDTIETKTGRLQLSLIDGGKVSLQPNTVYKINKYEFSGKEDGSEYAFTELLKGGLRTVSGLIGHKNRERYQLKTAVATIGIRGTEFTVNFNDNQLLMTTNHGSVDVCNAGGCLNAVTGQSIAVAGVGAAPKPSGKAAKAAAAAPASSKAVFSAGDNIVIPVASLANYKGEAYASVVMKTVGNNGVDGVLELENLETNANSQPIAMNTAGNGIDIHPTFNTALPFSSYNSDGLVAWGRANGGTVDVSPANNMGRPTTSDTTRWIDYAAGTRPDPTQLANLTGTYNVFGSTAPMLVTSGGTSVIVGAENAVTGNFVFNFATTNYNYGLTVNTVGETFILAGGGNVTANDPRFFSSNNQSQVVSLGNSCFLNSCAGALQGNLVQGAFFGPNGERIGLQYGFNAGTLGGQVYGTAVLK